MATVRIILHGKAAGDARVRKAVQALRRDGHLIEVRVTWEPGDAARLTAEAVAEARNEGLDCIVAGGGDGTINEVFAAAYAAGLPAGCALGVLPLGTANDFAHAAGVPVDDLTAALRIAASAPSRAIDLGLVDGRPFINLVSGGFGSRVTAETDPELKRRLGGLAYAITGISRFAELSANRGVFRAEGFSPQEHTGRHDCGRARSDAARISILAAALPLFGFGFVADWLEVTSTCLNAHRTRPRRPFVTPFRSAQGFNFGSDGRPVLKFLAAAGALRLHPSADRQSERFLRSVLKNQLSCDIGFEPS